METLKKILARQRQITAEYLDALDRHLSDIVAGTATEMMEINEIAGQLHIHPTHLSNTIRLATGHSACYFFEEKILNIAKDLLEKNELTIGAIATTLTYDPSNFTKFFKTYTQKTPKQYREDFLAGGETVRVTKKSVTVTRA